MKIVYRLCVLLCVLFLLSCKTQEVVQENEQPKTTTINSAKPTINPTETPSDSKALLDKYARQKADLLCRRREMDKLILSDPSQEAKAGKIINEIDLEISKLDQEVHKIFQREGGEDIYERLVSKYDANCHKQ